MVPLLYVRGASVTLCLCLKPDNCTPHMWKSQVRFLLDNALDLCNTWDNWKQGETLWILRH
jgi:hypothetical protein